MLMSGTVMLDRHSRAAIVWQGDGGGVRASSNEQANEPMLSPQWPRLTGDRAPRGAGCRARRHQSSRANPAALAILDAQRSACPVSSSGAGQPVPTGGGAAPRLRPCDREHFREPPIGARSYRCAPAGAARLGRLEFLLPSSRPRHSSHDRHTSPPAPACLTGLSKSSRPRSADPRRSPCR